MLRALGRVGVRIGLAVGLVLIVGGVVVAARLTDDQDNVSHFNTGEAQATTATAPAESDDGEVLPTPSDDADGAIAQAATSFTTAWLSRDRSAAGWQAALAPLSTGTLAASLEGVNPKSVPATRMLGQPTLVLRSELYAQVRVAVDTGTLLLSLLSQNGRWLVDAVDWERA